MSRGIHLSMPAVVQQDEPVAHSVWKLVPVEPTAAMIQAAGPRWVDQSNTYRAMVASAPQPAPVAQPLNLSDKAVQKRLAAQWGFVPAAQHPVHDTINRLCRAVQAAERERAARVCDDEARIRTEAGNTHPEESESRGRCFAGSRAAINCAKGVRGGEVV